jgi:hypothetical protein
MEIIHQQVQRKKEKMVRLADLQRKIDEATEEVCHLAQDEQDRRPQHRELRQEGLFNEDGWYDDFNHDVYTFNDASPLAAELQATPWPPSYKLPQLLMYDGHSDPKQFLMSYGATISSYGGNTSVMVKSFDMSVQNVAQTWYSSLRPGTITSWQKLKDMLVTSFQGFQTKPVTAQALFQCTQDHEEYLQAYVRRFLRLRAQVPSVPNEIVIESMIKGLRPGPTAQYFARKPPQTLENLLQKMDEYIRADNDFRQRREEAYRFSKMTRGFGGRIHPRHVRSIHNSTQSDDKGSQSQRSQYTSQSLGQQQSSFRPPAPRGKGARGFGGRFGDQPRKIYFLFYGEDKGHTTRMCHVTIQKQKEIAEAEARQNQPKQVLHTASCHSPYIPEYVSNHPAASVVSASHSQASWPQLPPHHHYNRPIPEASSQKGASTLNGNGNSGRNPKLAQSIVLWRNPSTSIERYPTFETFLRSLPFCFLIRNNQCKSGFNFL